MNPGPIYMMRDAVFGQDFTPKLWAALVGILLVAWDCRTQKRLDYLWVFLTGTILWGAAEAFLSIEGIRDMPVRELFGRPLGLSMSYVLQGASEGAFVAVLGLFLADRFLCPDRRRRAWFLGAGALLLIVASTVRSHRFLVGLPAASRRDILDVRGGVALLVMCVLALVFVIGWRAWRPRAIGMFVAMVVIGAVWAVSQLLVGGRWIEVVTANGELVRAGPLVTLLAFTWDVVMEIALVYVPFLAIPVWLRLLRNPTPLPVPTRVKG